MDLDRVVAFMAHHREFEKELDRICRIFFNTRYNTQNTPNFDLFGFVERFEIHKDVDSVFVSCGWKDGNDDYEDFLVPLDWFAASNERLIGYARSIRDDQVNKEQEENEQNKREKLGHLECTCRRLRRELGLEELGK